MALQNGMMNPMNSHFFNFALDERYWHDLSPLRAF